MIGNFLDNFEILNSYVKTALATFQPTLGKCVVLFIPASGHTCRECQSYSFVFAPYYGTNLGGNNHRYQSFVFFKKVINYFCTFEHQDLTWFLLNNDYLPELEWRSDPVILSTKGVMLQNCITYFPLLIYPTIMTIKRKIPHCNITPLAKVGQIKSGQFSIFYFYYFNWVKLSWGNVICVWNGGMSMGK